MSSALSVAHPIPTASEQALVAAVRRGEVQAFEHLYSRYRRQIGSYVFRIVADHGRAEDITQEVFISALRRIQASERPIAFKPWIYEIAKNACIDDLRRTGRGREVPIEVDDELGGQNLRLVATTPTPEVAAEGRQRLADLRGAFRGLSESHHKLIVMRELEGRSYDEIGSRLGMSRAVVESALFRARRRLGDEYDELVSGRRCEHVQSIVGEREASTVARLGIKERRLIARHLSHCQPCRRVARLAGLERSLLEKPGLAGRIAALVPIPAWLRWRRGSRSTIATSSGPHSLSRLPFASAQNLAASVDPTTLSGYGRVAAAAATLAIAGAGGGIVTGLALSSKPTRSTATAGTSAGARAARNAGAEAGRIAAAGAVSEASTRIGRPARTSSGARQRVRSARSPSGSQSATTTVLGVAGGGVAHHPSQPSTTGHSSSVIGAAPSSGMGAGKTGVAGTGGSALNGPTPSLPTTSSLPTLPALSSLPSTTTPTVSAPSLSAPLIRLGRSGSHPARPSVKQFVERSAAAAASEAKYAPAR